MKIINGKTATIFILACSGLFSATSQAAGQAVNIDITGQVIASPCVVNSSNTSLAVDLGTSIQANDLATAGSATAWKDVILKLTNCPASTSSFTVSFAGTADTDPDFYQNTGTATNLKLELTDNVGNAVYKNGASLANVTIPSATHAYDLEMRARAVSKGNVMPGTIVGQVQATFTYQ
ncbi:TPA: type 1 fimbrial protein [Citrobacter braakii]|jgi:minor fimbrial subunit|uniref:fimbrial protein n=1 Tax=Citrobacter TaxID=544 RepID=UPI0015E95BCA|nr:MULTISPECIES: fimbrial protein [Citrobacter]MCY9798210.1 fimbrial protein [Citrobacter braakii]MDL4384213.1 fimbrial protein [Citrobacter braakii]MDV0580794.1 fimbrial protein [Citrobacter braakii]MDW2592981.1 fimbrial protein [Citrobacter braakii]MDW2656953.1 fimbrial protein [Citrobacter braakii]